MPVEHTVDMKGKNMPCAEIERRVKLQLKFRLSFHGESESKMKFRPAEDHRDFCPKKRINRGRKTVSRTLRTSIFKRDRYACQSLNCSHVGKEGLTIDHIVPVSKGGTNDPKNLQAMCFDCNNQKGDKLNYENYTQE